VSASSEASPGLFLGFASAEMFGGAAMTVTAENDLTSDINGSYGVTA
jgi:hypothetical protein